MDYVVRWDWGTLLIYILLAFFCGFCLKRSTFCKNKNKTIKILKKELGLQYFYYILITVVLVLFMCTRVIKGTIGGSDSLRYIEFFNTFDYTKFVLSDILTMHGWEYIFFNLMYFIRIIGGNYTVFMFITYTILVLCYIYYYDKNESDEKIWFVSLFFILSYLKSMNTIRNSLAAAIGLIALEMIKNKNDIKFVIYFIFAYLTHYISIVLLPFWAFCKFVPEKLYNSRNKTLLISVGTFTLTLIGIPLIKQLLLLTRYAGYIDDIRFSPWGYMVYTVMYLLILFVYDDFINELKEKKHVIFYKMIIFLSLVVAPFAVINGTQRLLLYFEIPRFIMYGDLYNVYERKIPFKYKKIFKILIIILIIIWIIFRIWRMYYASGIMPYKNIFFD